MFQPENETYEGQLEKLILRAHANQWSVDTRIDWSLDPVLPDGMPRDAYISMVSQLYFAEEASVQLCARLIRELPELQAKLYVCSWAADEARHLQAYRMYLEKLGGIAPITPDMAELFREGLAYPGPTWGLVCAMNIILEHEARAQQKRRITQLPCPLFKQVNQAIIVDESRHCRFGVLYLEQTLPHVGRAQKRDVFEWLQSLWGRWCQCHVHRYTIAGTEMLHLRQEELQDSWMKRQAQFRRLGLLEDVA